MIETSVPLFLTERESQAVFRALVEYWKLLKYSELAGATVIIEEQQAVNAVSEKMSLLSFYTGEQRYGL